MKFYVNAKTLNNALVIVGQAIAIKPTHPILACVRLYANGDTGRVCGFDLKTAIYKGFAVDYQGEVPTDVCVPYQLFSSIVSKLDGDILLSFTESDDSLKLSIQSDTGHYDLSCLPSNDYPELPQLEGEAIKLSGDTLREAIAAVASSASTDETKQILCGINLATDKGTLYFNATNGHTLARYWSDGCQDDLSVTIPTKALLSVAKSTDSDIEMVLGEQQVKFFAGDLTIISRILDGAFPKVSQLVPVQFEWVVTVEASKLKSAISRLTAFADPKNNVITMTVNDTTEAPELVIETASSEIGQGTESIPCTTTGNHYGDKDSPTQIGMNFKYVVNGINAVGGKEIKLKINQANQPIIFTGSDNSLFLLMPVQVIK
jgi:DNA polymerase-3 subunit beta